MNFSWKIFKAYLFSKRAGSAIKTISRISIFNVAVGVMSFVVVISVMSGFRDSLTQRFFNIEPHLVTESEFNIKTIDELKKEPNVKKVVRYAQSDVIIRTGEGIFDGAFLKGYEKSFIYELMERLYDSQLEKVEKSGQSHEKANVINEKKEFLLSIINKLKPNEIILGSGLAIQMNLIEGDKVLIIPPESLLLPEGELPQFLKMTVAGTFTSNVPDIDTRYVFYRFYDGVDEFKGNLSHKGGSEIWLNEPYDYGALQKKLQSKNIVTKSWRERNASLFYAITIEKYTMGTFLFLAGLVTCLSIVSVMVLILLQKQNDIGILLTLGLSKIRIQKVFTQLGLYLSFIGMGIGFLLGLFICIFLYSVPLDVLSNIYYDTTIPVKIDPYVFLGVVVVAIVISFLVSWLPTRRMSKTSPVDSLRK